MTDRPVVRQPYVGTPMGQPQALRPPAVPLQRLGPPAPYGRPTSGIAVVGFMASLLWVFGLGSLLGLLLCWVATGGTRTGEEGGHGLAVAGMVLGVLGLIPGALILGGLVLTLLA
jgi:hypothetical protein